jgi:hypothetical protein
MVEITRDDLQEMVNETQGLASWDSVWRLLSGCIVVHETLGSGTILDREGAYLPVRFGSAVQRMSVSHFHHFVTSVDIPDTHPLADRARTFHRLAILVEAKRPVLEAWGIDPTTVGRRGVDRLSNILEFMEAVPTAILDRDDREFIERIGFAWVEAMHLERSMLVGNMMKAAQIWRRCEDPDESIRIARDILDDAEPDNVGTQAKALTVLANGLRMKGRQTGSAVLLKEAISVAMRSARLHESYHPFLVAMGAASDLGDQERSASFGEKAKALGAPRLAIEEPTLPVIKRPARKIRPASRPPAEWTDFLRNL